MKKRIFKIYFLLISAIFLGINLNQEEAHAQGAKGGTYTVQENSNCPHGLMHKCHGHGDFCDYTAGWDCAKPNNSITII